MAKPVAKAAQVCTVWMFPGRGATCGMERWAEVLGMGNPGGGERPWGRGGPWGGVEEEEVEGAGWWGLAPPVALA